MRIQLLMGGALVAAALMTGGAYAQAQPQTDISGTLGAMSCADFTQMGPTAQADALKQVGAPNPAGSLTSNSGSGDAGANATAPSAAGTPLTAGQLIAACQAASPTTTVHDAFSSFNAGANVPVKTK